MILDLRLAGAAVSGWAAAWILCAAPGWSTVSQLGLWPAAVALPALVLALPRSPGSGALSRSARTILTQGALCCAAAALVAASVAVAAPARLPAEITHAATGHTVVVATLTVSSSPVETASFGDGFGGAQAGSARVRFRGSLTELAQSGRSVVVAVPVVVFAEAPAGPDLRIGTVIRLPARLRPTEPGDAAAVLVFGREPPETVADPPWWLAWANELRALFADAAARLPGDGGDLLPGLAIGDTGAVGPALDGAMKTSSLSHLTAVSGDTVARRDGSSNR